MPPVNEVITRIAPSPTGFLHLGNARTALFNFLFAKAKGGKFLLRLEDTDEQRSAISFSDSILEDLKWLGMDIDGEIISQSNREAIYQNQAEKLVKIGAAYPCFCDKQTLELERRAQLKSGKAPGYSGKCSNLSQDDVQQKVDANQKYVIRFKVPKNQKIAFNDLVRGTQTIKSKDIKDFVLLRADGSASFLLANTVDDGLMNISHVIRGEDHLANVPKQILLSEALGFKMPKYAHLPMIVNDSGKPLSKRDGDFAVREFKAQGFLSQALINYIARLGHSYTENTILDVKQLTNSFAISKLGKSPGRFDLSQLVKYQQDSMYLLSDEAFLDWASPAMTKVPKDLREQFTALIKPNVATLGDVNLWQQNIFADTLKFTGHIGETIKAAGVDFFVKAHEIYTKHHDLDKLLEGLKASGYTGKDLFKPLRLSFTGLEGGPTLPDIVNFLGPTRVLARFRQAQKYVENI